MTIHRTIDLPSGAKAGDAWVGPRGDFKRVLSRGGAWENVNPGVKHPDEVDHGEQQQERPETEQRDDSTEVSGGPSESAPGDGDDGQVSGVSTGGEENSGVTPPPPPNPEGSLGSGLSEDPGIDANGSPVV